MAIDCSANTGLIKTKYSLPRVNKHLIPRQELNQKLEDSLNCQLTIITAPAGYGKTTAVLKWLEHITLPYTWLSLDSRDNDAIVFWRYICAALDDSILNDILENVEYVFKSQELFEANTHISILIDGLSNINSDFLLVIDDVHLITNQEILDQLSYFITYMPHNMHIVLTSRTEPPLKLAKLGLHEDIVRIDTNDLCFNTEEILQYYRERGYFLQRKDAVRIESYTEGWAAALVAVVLSIKENKPKHNIAESFEISNRHIKNYLIEEVFNTWTKEQQDFMVKTSILDRLSAPLCQYITGYDGSRLLKELYDQNSFLVALDNEGIWFRYHHLFSDFLQNKLEKENAAMIKELHHRAAEWMAANDYYSGAIEHFLSGSFYEEALVLIERFSRFLGGKGEYSTVNSWIMKLPDRYIKKSPAIMMYKSVYYAEIYDFKRAWENIGDLENMMKEDPSVFEAYNTEYIMYKANLFLRQGDIRNLLSAVNEAEACGKNTNISRDYMDFNLYEISSYRSTACTFIKALKQEPETFYSMVKSYRSLINRHPGYAPLCEGEFYYESRRLDEALPKLTSAIEEAASVSCLGVIVPAVVTLAKIRLAHGDFQGALGIIEECENRIQKFNKPNWGYMMNAFRIRMYMETGNTEMADRWINESRLSLYQVITRPQEYELIVLARVLIGKQRYGDAYILLNRLLSFADEQKRTHSRVEITNLLAITAYKTNNMEIAMVNLENALSIGIEEGYVSSFTDELAPMISLLKMFLKRNTEENSMTAYTRDLLKNTEDTVKNSKNLEGSNTIYELLTPMEKKVLDLMINASDNKEIADELGITIRTVKAHTCNIYKKLGVKNRMQCIKKVRSISSNEP